jgi:hypothetical protein
MSQQGDSAPEHIRMATRLRLGCAVGPGSGPIFIRTQPTGAPTHGAPLGTRTHLIYINPILYRADNKEVILLTSSLLSSPNFSSLNLSSPYLSSSYLTSPYLIVLTLPILPFLLLSYLPYLTLIS